MSSDKSARRGCEFEDRGVGQGVIADLLGGGGIGIILFYVQQEVQRWMQSVEIYVPVGVHVLTPIMFVFSACVNRSYQP